MLDISKRFFMVVTAIIFLSVGLLHGLRVYLGWDLILGPWVVPIWISLLVVLVAFLMLIAAVRHLV